MKGTMTWTVSCSCGWSGSTTDVDFHDAVLYDLEAGHECKAKRQKHAWPVGRVRGPVPPCPGGQTWTDREEEAHKSIIREIAKVPE